MSLTYGFCLDELSSVYDSAQFSDVFHAVVGDGVSLSGSRLAVSINGFTATVGTGYALAAGRWLENDEPLGMTIRAAGDNEDRTDALVVRVDYKAKKAALELLTDIDPGKLPDVLQSDEEYSIVLYLIRVPRGATTLTPENVTDMRADKNLCGTVVPLPAIAKDVLYVYQFLRSGIDTEVDRIVALGQTLVEQANTAIANLGKEIQKVGGGPQIGELCTARRDPQGDWLLCDGGTVPAEYPDLSALIGSTLPDISRSSDRYKTYIFGGN